MPPRRTALFVYKFVTVCLLVTVVMCGLMACLPIRKDECQCSNQKSALKVSSGGHNLAVLVPYRDRFEELFEFVPHLHSFLNKQGIHHHIYILNQADDLRFNRASLINVGFKESDKNCDYIAMHDVDLLPLNDKLSYKFPSQVFHVASPSLHPRYHYPTFVGGILLVKREDYKRVNGMSNKYWGWGLEDDEFYARLKEAKINISRPPDIGTGTHNTFRHIHDRNKRKRDMAKCYNQKEVTSRRDRQTGLNSVAYKIKSRHDMMIDNAPATIINVILLCDRGITPWCICDNSPNSDNQHIDPRGNEEKIIPKVKKESRYKGDHV